MVGDRPAVSLDRLGASLRLAELAGLAGAALVCPIRNPSGSAAGPTALAAFGRCHDVPSVAAAEVLSFAPPRPRLRSRGARRRPWRLPVRRGGSRVAPAGTVSM